MRKEKAPTLKLQVESYQAKYRDSGFLNRCFRYHIVFPIGLQCRHYGLQKLGQIDLVSMIRSAKIELDRVRFFIGPQFGT